MHFNMFINKNLKKFENKKKLIKRKALAFI